MRLRHRNGWTRLLAGISVLLAALTLTACFRSPEAKAARFLESGKKYLADRDYARAIIQFKNAARSRPNDPAPHHQLGLAYLGTGDVRAALAHLRKATELDPKHVEAQLVLAELMALNRNPEVVKEAERRAEAALEVDPDNPDLLSTVALAEVRLGKPKDAEEHLLEALRYAPQHLKSSTTLALLKVSQRDLDGAEEVLRQATVQAPRSPEAALALGRFYAMRRKLAEAEAEFRRAVQVAPRHGEALMDLGRFLLAAGRAGDARDVFRQVSALPEKRYQHIYAAFLFQQGERDAAIAEFARLAREDPKDRSARSRLVTAYVAAGKLPEAEKVLGEALQDNPKDAQALLERSQIEVRRGKFDDAQRDLTQVLQIQSDSGEAHCLLSKVHRGRGSPLSERQELGEALRLNPRLLRARLDLARSLLEAKSAKAALDLMNQAPEEQRKLLPVIIQRNWALLALSELQELRKGIDEGLAMRRVADLYLQDAWLNFRKRDYAAARASAEMMLKLAPDDTRGLDLVVLSYAAQNQAPTALQKLKEYAASRPRSAAVQHFLGQWLLRNGKNHEARTAFLAAKAANPDFKPVSIALAQLDVLENQLDPARDTLTELARAPEVAVRSQVLLGMLEYKAGRHSAAMDHYQKALAADPNNLIALNNLAYHLANDAKKPDEALKLAQLAKELAPDNPAVDGTLGWVYYCKGLYQSALPHLESAAQKTRDPTNQYHLAMAYYKAGNRERGRKVLADTLKIAPNTPEAKLAQELFEGGQ
jgi:tetratricopeptide (TPR) repeat protein